MASKTSGGKQRRAPRQAGKTIVPIYATSAAKEVWLSFDDGPDSTQTDRVLKTLDKFAIKATFFVVGRSAANYKQLVKRAFDQGHGIGNHSYTHADLARLTEAQIRDEIQRTEKVISDYIGREKI